MLVVNENMGKKTTNSERKDLIKKASKAIDKQYKNAFKMISKS